MDNASGHDVEADFCWVAGHQDNCKRWSQLTLEERINGMSDRLAKRALLAAVATGAFISSNFLFESLRLRFGCTKVTGQPRAALNEYWGQRVARNWFNKKWIVRQEHFHLVWWEGVECTMQFFPKIFCMFVTKNKPYGFAVKTNSWLALTRRSGMFSRAVDGVMKGPGISRTAPIPLGTACSNIRSMNSLAGCSLPE